MEARSRDRVAACAFAGLSPAECVIIFGDRLLKDRSRVRPSSVRIPLSGRHVDVDQLAFTSLCSALVALEAAGEVEVMLRPRKGLLRTGNQVHLRQLKSFREWPRHSPEARLRGWLTGRDAREAWLEDLIAAAVIPEVTTFPHRTAFEFLAAGLVKRGLVEAVERRVYLLLRVTEYQMVEGAAAAILRQADRGVDEYMRSHELSDAGLRGGFHAAWRGAIRLRSDTP